MYHLQSMGTALSKSYDVNDDSKFKHNKTYYFGIKALNNVGDWTPIKWTDGITVKLQNEFYTKAATLNTILDQQSYQANAEKWEFKWDVNDEDSKYVSWV